MHCQINAFAGLQINQSINKKPEVPQAHTPKKPQNSPKMGLSCMHAGSWDFVQRDPFATSCKK
jgi:hypothetical protein